MKAQGNEVQHKRSSNHVGQGKQNVVDNFGRISKQRRLIPRQTVEVGPKMDKLSRLFAPWRDINAYTYFCTYEAMNPWYEYFVTYWPSSRQPSIVVSTPERIIELSPYLKMRLKNIIHIFSLSLLASSRNRIVSWFASASKRKFMRIVWLLRVNSELIFISKTFLRVL